MAAPLILMGVVGRPHGVRGLVHVHSYTEEPTDLARYSPLLDERGRRWSLAWRGEGVAELSDAEGKPVADRSAAERLVNMRLSVERDRLPAPEADDFYLADLIGLEAVDQAGAPIGQVVAGARLRRRHQPGDRAGKCGCIAGAVYPERRCLT